MTGPLAWDQPTAVVSLSGGIDSLAVLAHYVASGHRIIAVTADYGQSHAVEIGAASRIVRHYGSSVVVDHKILPLRWLGDEASSALTDPEVSLPEGAYDEPSMAATVVHGRNLILGAACAAIAQSRGAEVVALGVHGGDHHIYADCRPAWVAAFAAAVAAQSEGAVRVEAPFLHMPKQATVAFAARAGAPIALTRTCYSRGEPCGRCGSCDERRRAFAALGLEDPITYPDQLQEAAS